jgi:hypothetical protein
MTDCKEVLHYHEYPVQDPLLIPHVDCVYFLRSEAGGSYFCVPNGRLGISLVLRGHVAYRATTVPWYHCPGRRFSAW